MAKAQRKDEQNRTMNWTCVQYPESAAEGWREILSELQVKVAVSPLHDKDVNPDGTVKKAHHHIVISFDGNKSYEQVCEITEAIKATIPQRCKSLKGTVRYMTHMDNPEKAQYSKSEITAYGGFDLDSMFTPTETDRLVHVEEMIDFIIQNDVVELIDMLTYAKYHKHDTWFPLLVNSCGYIIGQAIKSQRHKKTRVDSETGEIIG